MAVGKGRQQFMHTISAGSPADPPLVLLPGYGAGAGFYFRNLDGLSQHFRTHAVDLLGTGMSGAAYPASPLWPPKQPNVCCRIAIDPWTEHMSINP